MIAHARRMYTVNYVFTLILATSLFSSYSTAVEKNLEEQILGELINVSESCSENTFKVFESYNKQYLSKLPKYKILNPVKVTSSQDCQQTESPVNEKEVRFCLPKSFIQNRTFNKGKAAVSFSSIVRQNKIKIVVAWPLDVSKVFSNEQKFRALAEMNKTCGNRITDMAKTHWPNFFYENPQRLTLEMLTSDPARPGLNPIQVYNSLAARWIAVNMKEPVPKNMFQLNSDIFAMEYFLQPNYENKYRFVIELMKEDRRLQGWSIMVGSTIKDKSEVDYLSKLSGRILESIVWKQSP